MRTELQRREEILKQAMAAHHYLWWAVGGRLYLTNRRIVFESFWRGSHTQIVWLDRVRGARRCWTTLLGVIPLLPTSIAIAVQNRGEQKFVVSKRAEWITAITDAAK